MRFLVGTIAVVVPSLVVGLTAPSGSVSDALQMPVMRLDPQHQTVAHDGTFNVDVVVENAVEIAAFEFLLEFDPRIIAYVSVREGPFLASTGRTTTCPSAIVDVDFVRFGCSSFGMLPTPPSGNGTVATVTFRTRASGTTRLAFRLAGLALVLGEDVVVATVNGSVKVVGGPEPPPATATPEGGAAPPERREPHQGTVTAGTSPTPTAGAGVLGAAPSDTPSTDMAPLAGGPGNAGVGEGFPLAGASPGRASSRAIAVAGGGPHLNAEVSRTTQLTLLALSGAGSFLATLASAVLLLRRSRGLEHP